MLKKTCKSLRIPFSGANAAFGYLPLQLALQPEVKILKFVRKKADFPDEIGEYADLSGGRVVLRMK